MIFFISIRLGIKKLHCTSSELCEDVFDNLQQIIREFSALQMMHLIESIMREQMIMIKNSFSLSDKELKGY